MLHSPTGRLRWRPSLALAGALPSARPSGAPRRSSHAAPPIHLRPCWPALRQVRPALRDELQGPAASSGAASTEPDDRALRLWRSAQAVCFDIDCTLAMNDQLDLLAEFMGVGGDVARVTNHAMDGSMSLEAALEERLRIINCTPADIRAFLDAHPAGSRLSPGGLELVQALQARGVAVYLLSGGFRELCLPIAEALGVPRKNVFANRMMWQCDDDTGMPTRLVGFDLAEPTGKQRGKAKAIAQLRERYPYETIVMVGDGITDLEAVQETGGADIFIGYGGVVKRQAVADAADWFVDSFDVLYRALQRHRVAMVGSGAWACAAVRLVAENTLARDEGDRFVDEVRMWVHDEQLDDGRMLCQVINDTHENVKYLPGVNLGDNVRACTDLQEAIEGATVLVFCAPHQFIGGIVRACVGHVQPGAIAVSLTKGMRVRPEGPQLISDLIRKELGVDCSVLMGANIAADIARDELSEATIGFNILENGRLLQALFETDSFYTNLVADPVGAEMAGTLKNIVALGAGFVDGLGYGPNTKAVIMRVGLEEMRRFAQALYPAVRDSTFMESCGVADLIATCVGGRNRAVAEAYAQAEKAGAPRTMDQLEGELLHGQKLQGVLTSEEVQAILHSRGWEAQYPLFTTVNRIVRGQLPASAIASFRSAALLPLEVPPDGASTDEDAKAAAVLGV